ncbi:hypothetical protein EEB14_51245 [Rhodococcus sp. WS4]|nr:hypothetical protein EEB14_51245 [Rhodococcus sp. WS4]
MPRTVRVVVGLGLAVVVGLGLAVAVVSVGIVALVVFFSTPGEVRPVLATGDCIRILKISGNTVSEIESGERDCSDVEATFEIVNKLPGSAYCGKGYANQPLQDYTTEFFDSYHLVGTLCLMPNLRADTCYDIEREVRYFPAPCGSSPTVVKVASRADGTADQSECDGIDTIKVAVYDKDPKRTYCLVDAHG